MHTIVTPTPQHPDLQPTDTRGFLHSHRDHVTIAAISPYPGQPSSGYLVLGHHHTHQALTNAVTAYTRQPTGPLHAQQRHAVLLTTPTPADPHSTAYVHFVAPGDDHSAIPVIVIATAPEEAV